MKAQPGTALVRRNDTHRLIHSKYTELAVRALHDGFGLDKGPGTAGQG